MPARDLRSLPVKCKNLATQTAQATDEISAQISSVQDATKTSVKAIESVGSIIGQISEISSGIASAVEQQTATAEEMSQSMQAASRSVEDITNNIDQIAAVTKQIDASTKKVREASASIA